MLTGSCLWVCVPAGPRSKQLRTRDCAHCKVFLYAKTDPIVEASHHMSFAPFNGAYFGLAEVCVCAVCVCECVGCRVSSVECRVSGVECRVSSAVWCVGSMQWRTGARGC